MKDRARRIDWNEVRARLEHSRVALERAQQVDAERLEAVYRQRAAALAARRDTRASAAGTTLRVLVFALGPERYGIALGDLAEVLPFAGCTPVPGSAPELLGVINVHGEVRSLLDLGRLLSLPAGDGPAGYVLLLRKRGQEVGLRVDRVEKVQPLMLAELADLPEGSSEPRPRCVRGRSPDGVLLIDTDALLAHPVFARAARKAE